MPLDYDVIVVGAGHAGTEASVMAARLGAKVLLLTSNLDTIGQMSCNPAIGGIAKGTVVREIDALGGIMGRATDRATIQFRMLNRSKGPAVWAPRAQCDRTLYRRAVRELLESFPGIELTQGMVTRLILDGPRVAGVATADGRDFRARAVVLTAGTFLRGRIHLGTDTQIPAGRAGDQPAVDIAQHIDALGLTTSRFKTGTPPRVDGRSVDWSKAERQDGDGTAYRFSFYHHVELPRQLHVMIEGEAVGGAVSVLALDLGPIDAPTVHARRRAGLEARCRKSKCINVLCDIDGRLIASATGRDLGVSAEVDAAAEKRAGGEHHRARAKVAAVGGGDAGDARAVEYETRDHPLRELDARKALEQLPHRAAVQGAIALRPGRPDGGAHGENK